MRPDQTIIKARIQELQNIMDQTRHSVEADDGSAIRISTQHGYTRYYLVPPKGKEIYLPKSQMETIREIAQRCYEVEVYKCAEREKKYLERAIWNYPWKAPEDVHSLYNPKRQQLVEPLVLSDEEYVEQWESVKWEHKPFSPDDDTCYYNQLGVRMHSKQETIISDNLYDRGRPQRYEYPVYLEGIGKVHPDFTVLNPRTRKQFYWEHLGFWDDMTYRRVAIQRIAAYQKSGIFPGDQLILTFETSTYHPGFYEINEVIDHYLV